MILYDEDIAFQNKNKDAEPQKDDNKDLLQVLEKKNLDELLSSITSTLNTIFEYDAAQKKTSSYRQLK